MFAFVLQMIWLEIPFEIAKQHIRLASLIKILIADWNYWREKTYFESQFIMNDDDVCIRAYVFIYILTTKDESMKKKESISLTHR